MTFRAVFYSAAILACAAAPAQAQATKSADMMTAMAAGYKAMFVCSAMFNADRSLDEIASGEFARIYPDFRPFMDQVGEPVIDRQNKRVTVTFSDDMPPRVSAWREHLGCAALPVGAPVEGVAHLPRVALQRPAIDQSTAHWPDGDVTDDGPASDALDAGVLDAAVAAAFDGETFGEGNVTTAALVVHDGRIVAERYADGFDMHTSQRTWSVAKSIAATVIGAAVRQGVLDVDAPAHIPAWSTTGDPRAQITLGNLLNMASGLDSNRAGNRTNEIYFAGARVADHATESSLEATPGARWKYANNDTLLAVRSLRAALDDDERYLAFPFTEVFFKIGMLHTYPETDWGGDFILSSQVWTTSRDLARLGLLYLNDGVWNGERVLPEGWATYVASPAPSQPPPARASGRPYAGYGAQFWLLNERFPNIPNDAYVMLGNRGQIVVIVPSTNAVIVRRGFDGAPGANFDYAGFTRAVLAAIE